MDPNWINALIALATFLTLLTSLLIGYLFRLSNELSMYKIHVAEKYVTKPEMKALSESIERQMQTGFNRLYDILNKQQNQ